MNDYTEKKDRRCIQLLYGRFENILFLVKEEASPILYEKVEQVLMKTYQQLASLIEEDTE